MIDSVLAGERHIVTHGDLVNAVESRYRELAKAAVTARDKVGTWRAGWAMSPVSRPAEEGP